MMNASSRNIAKGAGVNVLGEILSFAGEPLLYFAISSLMGPDVLGIYILVGYCLALMCRLAIMGIDKGMLRFVPIAYGEKQDSGRIDRVLGTAVRQVVMVCGIIVLVVNLFPDVFLKIGGKTPALHAPYWLVIMVFAVPAQALTKTLLYAIRGISNMWAFVIVQNLFGPLLLLGVSLVPMLLSMNPILLAYGYTISAFGTVGIASWFFKRNFKRSTFKRLLFAETDWSLLRFSWPQGMTEILNFLLSRIDLLMIAAFFPERPELLAFYGIAALMAAVVKKVRLSFDNSAAPILSDLFASNDHEALRRHYENVGRWVFSLFVLFAGGLMMSAQFILSIYGEAYTEYWLVVPILAMGRVLNGAAGPAQVALLMSGHSKLELANNIFINILNIGLNALLIPRYHVFGAAMATSASLIVFSAIRAIEVAHLLKLWVDPKSAGRVALAGICAALPLFVWILVMHRLSPVAGLFFSVVYLVSYPLWWCAFGPRADINQLREAFNRYVKKRRGDAESSYRSV